MIFYSFSYCMSTLSQKFTEKKQTLAVSESLTAWYLQTKATEHSWASDFFLWWITCYTLEQKVDLLQVDRGLAQASNCVHETVAMMMAQWALEMFGSTLAAATTGYAEPNEDWWVGVPFAYYAIIAREPWNTWLVALKSWKIEQNWLIRVEMQQYVAQEVWGEIVNCVKAM